jgi:transposase InsO family protein
LVNLHSLGLAADSWPGARDDCLNEHWLTSLARARVEIERWRREYNKERPKKALGGLRSALYASKLATQALTMTAAL